MKSVFYNSIYLFTMKRSLNEIVESYVKGF